MNFCTNQISGFYVEDNWFLGSISEGKRHKYGTKLYRRAELNGIILHIFAYAGESDNLGGRDMHQV